jgi:hypothetical protein
MTSSAFSSPRSWVRNSSRLLPHVPVLHRSHLWLRSFWPLVHSFNCVFTLHPHLLNILVLVCSSPRSYPRRSSLLPPPTGASRSSLLARSFLLPPFVLQSASSPCVLAIPFHCSHLRLRPTSSRSLVTCLRPAPSVPFFMILSRYFSLRPRPSPSAVQRSSSTQSSFAVHSFRIPLTRCFSPAT